MSILTTPLKETIEVAGQDYPVRTDFRVWLEFEEILNTDVPLPEKILKIILLCIPSGEDRKLPPTMEELFEGLSKFYTAGFYKKNEQKKKNDNTKSVMTFSFEYDAEYVYAAFLAQYGIDLIEIPYLHWHKFLALFRGLEEKNRIMQIIGYRSIDLSEISDKKQRKMYSELKDAYSLPDNRSQEEKDSDFARRLYMGF